MDPKEFGSYIKKIRTEKGLSITEMAKNAGISHPYLSQIENGKKGMPSVKVLKKLTEPLEVPYYELMAKAGYIAEKEINDAIIQEGINFKENIVMDRIEINRNSPKQDLLTLLENKNNLTYNGWGLNDIDRKQIIDMLKVLFPAYSKEKRENKKE